jgi:prepilin-type N-terminal cleavage/methylation domain-containing protein
MSLPGWKKSSSLPFARRRNAAFTLVEIMVVVTIISLLAALSVPALQRVKRRTIATAIGNDLRTFAAAFDTYAAERGGFPAEVAAGVFPSEMVDRIKPGDWGRVTPIGGQYNWDNNQTHYGTKYRAVIQISSTATATLLQDVDLWEAVDRTIDDGNLTTGSFRLGADDEPIFIVSP